MSFTASEKWMPRLAATAHTSTQNTDPNRKNRARGVRRARPPPTTTNRAVARARAQIRHPETQIHAPVAVTTDRQTELSTVEPWCVEVSTVSSVSTECRLSVEGVSRECRGSVEGVSSVCRLTPVSRCRGCRGSVDGDLDVRDALMLSGCRGCRVSSVEGVERCRRCRWCQRCR